jgi:hypothetical protein
MPSVPPPQSANNSFLSEDAGVSETWWLAQATQQADDGDAKKTFVDSRKRRRPPTTYGQHKKALTTMSVACLDTLDSPPPPPIYAWDIETDKCASDETGVEGIDVTCASACLYRWNSSLMRYTHCETTTWFSTKTVTETEDCDLTVYRGEELTRKSSNGHTDLQEKDEWPQEEEEEEEESGTQPKGFFHLNHVNSAPPQDASTQEGYDYDPDTVTTTTVGANHMDARCVERMLSKLEYMDEKEGATVITWNGTGFDFRVVENILRLAGLTERADAAKALAMKHVDLMFQFFCDKGYAVSLGKVAKAMLPSSCNEKLMKGKDAPAEWTSGDPQRQAVVLSYCDMDAKLLGDVAALVSQKGTMKWISKRGNIATWRLPRDFVDCTVQSANSDPLPDVDWMADYEMIPWHREKFTAWL